MPYPLNSANLTVRRLADTAANRQRLVAEAARDQLPSAVVTMGQDVALFSGTALRTASALDRSGAQSIARGQNLAIEGNTATVLHTDDGFSEIDASAVIVAVIDTGVDVNHPAFRGKLVQGYNSVDGSTNVRDTEGHGTHVAGTIAGAWGLNAQAGGVAPNAKIMPIKAADARNAFTDQSIADGIIYAVQHGAKVINLSLRDSVDLPRTHFAIEYARVSGVVVVAAAGNAGVDQVDRPAVYDGVLAVGSSKDGRRSAFSNGGDRLDLTAPGEDILAPLANTGSYARRSGTSMAAPYAAGAAALIIARNPHWTAEQVTNHLRASVIDRGARGKDRDFGHGDLDLFQAVYGGQANRATNPAPRWTHGAPQTPGVGTRLMNWLRSLVPATAPTGNWQVDL